MEPEQRPQDVVDLEPTQVTQGPHRSGRTRHEPERY